MFDIIIDGDSITNVKPDPEVFLKCSEGMGVEPSSCVVFEDAIAGVQAAHAGGMKCVGIGNPGVLAEADIVVADLNGITLEQLRKL